MAVCAALYRNGMTLAKNIPLIGIIVFYTWRMNGRWREFPMLLATLPVYIGAMGMFFLGGSLTILGHDAQGRIIYMIMNVCMRTVLFNVCCSGSYEIRERITDLKQNKE